LITRKGKGKSNERNERGEKLKLKTEHAVLCEEKRDARRKHNHLLPSKRFFIFRFTWRFEILGIAERLLTFLDHDVVVAAAVLVC
jgi:hypothetical protein